MMGTTIDLVLGALSAIAVLSTKSVANLIRRKNNSGYDRRNERETINNLLSGIESRLDRLDDDSKLMHLRYHEGNKILQQLTVKVDMILSGKINIGSDKK